MRLYLETAYVAKCYLKEPDSLAVQALARSGEYLYTSALTVAEFACVLRRHEREGRISNALAGQIAFEFRRDVQDEVWRLLSISDGLMFRLEEYLRSLIGVGLLRAGDALHLLTAREAGFSEVWSNDRRLLAAASYFGL